MKAAILILALMLALAATNCHGEEKPAYSVIIANGYIVIRSTEEMPRQFGRRPIEQWADFLGYKRPLSLDDVRHLVLNAVAAVIIGGGSREYGLDREARVATVEEVEQGKADAATMTMEKGIGFTILRDTPITLRAYRADIQTISGPQLEKATVNL